MLTTNFEKHAKEDNTVIISEHDVSKTFESVNTRKAARPDGITGWVLKACANQLSPLFTDIFNVSLCYVTKFCHNAVFGLIFIV